MEEGSVVNLGIKSPAVSRRYPVGFIEWCVQSCMSTITHSRMGLSWEISLSLPEAGPELL